MNRSRFGLGLALTALAGAIDVVTFARFEGVYASFMSGNTVQIGLHLAAGHVPQLLAIASLLGLFCVGALFGSVVVSTAGRWHLPIVLTTEAILIAAAAALDGSDAAISVWPPQLLALAMGAQNALVVLVRGSNAGTTFVTGTLFRLADAIVQRSLGRDHDGAWRLHLTVWSAFAVGAVVGGFAHLRLGKAALVPMTTLVVILAVATFVAAMRRRTLTD